jgi:hypothetical protein
MRPVELIGDVALDVVTAFWLARTLWRGWRLAR